MLGFVDLLRLELRTLLADRAIMLTLFGGVIFYSFLYPQPYLHQLPREEAVVVVNEDGSQLSRQLEFMADATPQAALDRRGEVLLVWDTTAAPEAEAEAVGPPEQLMSTPRVESVPGADAGATP